MKIEIGSVEPGTNGAGGWDMQVSVTDTDGNYLVGDATLLPAEYDGRPGSWGSLHHWLTSSLHDLPAEVINEIEIACSDAVAQSGVGPADAYTDEEV